MAAPTPIQNGQVETDSPSHPRIASTALRMFNPRSDPCMSQRQAFEDEAIIYGSRKSNFAAWWAARNAYSMCLAFNGLLYLGPDQGFTFGWESGREYPNTLGGSMESMYDEQDMGIPPGPEWQA